MVSRKCPGSFLWLAVMALNSVRCSLSQANTITGDGQAEESTTMFPDILQADESTPKPEYDKTHPCYRFSVVDHDKKQFFSPGFDYEETYRNNTQCVLVLEAPPGKLIRLDFRDYFEIEPSTKCRNDFLEVRNGPYSFSELLGGQPLCGFGFPSSALQSSDRHLWLYFKSDENIEYKGFKAVYEFIDRTTSTKTPEIMPCRYDLSDMEEGKFSKSNISEEINKFTLENGMPTDCLWTVTVKKDWRIQLQFEKFDLEKPNECEKNFIEVSSGRAEMPSRGKKFCGSVADTFTSDHNELFVRFFTELPSNKSTFEANFTAFRDKNDSVHKGDCAEDEYDCDDDTCISNTLRCNGRYNCRFRWDEDECQGAQSLSLTEDHIIVIMVIFSLILSGMCFTFIFNCVKKLIRDHHTIQEYIRQSREQQLNELDKQEQVEKKLSKSASRSHSNSSASSNSAHFDVSNSATTPCYVPGGELLPILIRNERSMSPPNGDVYHPDNIYTVDNETMPEMCDSACQTRESLFTTQGYSSGNSTPNHSVHTNSPPAPFSTFGYKKDNKFKAEAKIEVAPKKTKFEEKRRPYSVQTTKSAPDVIVTH